MRRNFMASAIICLMAVPAARAGDINPPAGPVAPTGGPNPGVVVNATNTPGDATAKFIISAPGRYRLDENLNHTGMSAAIRITSPDVWLQLDGFTVSGTGAPGQDGLGILVDVSAPGAATVTIENGIIDGFQSGVAILNFPVNAASNVVLDRIRAVNNDEIGVFSTGSHGVRMYDVVASRNGSSGIDTAIARVTAQRVAADHNGGVGVLAGPASSLEHVQASSNDGPGVQVGAGSDVRHVKAATNGQSGIVTAADSTVGDFVVSGNAQDGIRGGTLMTVRDGYAIANGEAGVNIGSGNQSGVTSRNNDLGLKSAGAVRVRDSRMTSNKSVGIDAGPESAIDSSDVRNNADGVVLGDRSTITNSIISGNQNNGVSGNEHITITGTTLHNNGNQGVILGQFATLDRVSASLHPIGLSVAGGSRITNSTVSKNGDGIRSNGPTVIADNTIVANGIGVVVFNNGSGTRISGNTLKAHSGGAGIFLMGNNCAVLSNYFRDNATDVNDAGVGNKIAPIQCDPLTAGPHDNWALEPMR